MNMHEIIEVFQEIKEAYPEYRNVRIYMGFASIPLGVRRSFIHNDRLLVGIVLGAKPFIALNHYALHTGLKTKDEVALILGHELSHLHLEGEGPEVELEADLSGAKIAASLGYNVRKAVDILSRECRDPNPSRHPPAQARINYILENLFKGNII